MTSWMASLSRWPTVPTRRMDGRVAQWWCGMPKLLLSASGFRGEVWLTHWATAYAAHVCPLSTAALGTRRRWWSAARQGVETIFANLRESFGLKYPDAHTGWGLLMRVAAQVAAYNLGIALSRLFGRPDFAFATLIA